VYWIEIGTLGQYDRWFRNLRRAKNKARELARINLGVPIRIYRAAYKDPSFMKGRIRCASDEYIIAMYRVAPKKPAVLSCPCRKDVGCQTQSAACAGATPPAKEPEEGWIARLCAGFRSLLL